MSYAKVTYESPFTRTINEIQVELQEKYPQLTFEAAFYIAAAIFGGIPGIGGAVIVKGIGSVVYNSVSHNLFEERITYEPREPVTEEDWTVV